MPKFDVEYRLERFGRGSIEVEAETPEQAIELVEAGNGPSTEELIEELNSEDTDVEAWIDDEEVD